MSVQDNKVAVRRLYDEMVNGKEWGFVEELFAPDFVGFEEAPLGEGSREEFKQTMVNLRQTFPDSVQVVEDLIAEGDKVVARWVLQGTHHGEFMGVPGTDKPFHMEGVDIWRLRDGKIVGHWIIVDLYGMMRQTGANPAPGREPVRHSA